MLTQKNFDPQKFWPPKNLDPNKILTPKNIWHKKKQIQLQVWVLDLDWSLTISFGPKISWTNHISLLPSSGPAPAQQSWPGLALFSFPPDMWQKIHQICGRRSPRYVAEDHPDMWQKISQPEKYIFQQAAMKISTPFQTKPNLHIFWKLTKIARSAMGALAYVADSRGKVHISLRSSEDDQV